MRETEYAYAVARIRANELSLLGAADVEQIILAPSAAAAEQLLRDKGYEDMDAKAQQTWDLLTEILPKAGELDFLIIKNDFHNLKALIKSLFAGSPADAHFIRPCVYDPQDIAQALQAKRFEALPACMHACAETAYDLLAATADGQLADSVIDRQCLETTRSMAAGLHNAFAAQLADMMCAFANIRVAVRAMRTGKGEDFLGKALCNCAALPKQELMEACALGGKALQEFLQEGPYREALEAMERSGTAFEKYCDDALLAHALPAKSSSFGLEPLVAFYLAREAEIKNLRIVRSARQNGVAAQEIRRRVRQLYV